MDYQQSYTKGWSDEGLWRAFIEAQRAGELFEMDCIIRAQGAQRPPVDARVHQTNSLDLDIMEDLPIEAPAFESQERGEEYKELRRLVDLRDKPFNELPSDLRKPLKCMSYFAQFQTIDAYIPGRDYMTEQAEYEAIQRGDKPLEIVQRIGLPRHFQTGRDLATFVHDDNPMINWMPVAAELERLSIPKRTEFSQDNPDCNADSDFTCWGPVKIFGMLGEVMERTGHLSFREKWDSLTPRPEEYGPKMGVGLLPQTFPEGSPTHPSFTAMHAFLAYAMGYLLMKLYDVHAELPSGTTVGDEIELWAENIAYGRLWAGVHYASDNEQTKGRADALAERVVNKHLQKNDFVLSF